MKALLIIFGILFIAAGIVIPIIRNYYADESDSKRKKSNVMILSSLVAIGVILFVLGLFTTSVKAGQIVRVYGVGQNDRYLSTGYHLVPIWQKQDTYDITYQEFTFYQQSATEDPTDVFGGQTKSGDYMTTVANLKVKIDINRIEQYIADYGSASLSNSVPSALKAILKASFENCLASYESEEVMANKPAISDEASNAAKAKIEESLPVIVSYISFPDIEASAEYEQAIKDKADVRMKTEQAILQATLNEELAKADKVKADGDKIVSVTQAEAKAEAAKAQANGEAEVITIKAKAEADAAKIIAEIYKQYPHLFNIKELEISETYAENWNGMLPMFGDSGEILGFVNFTDMMEKWYDMGIIDSNNNVVPQTEENTNQP